MVEHDTRGDITAEIWLQAHFQHFFYKYTELSSKIGLVENASDEDIGVDGWDYFAKSSHFALHILHTCELLEAHNQTLRNKKILDLGCGTGIVINYLSWMYEMEGLGIELYPLIAQEANQVCQAFRQEQGFNRINTRVAAGNFFPPNFQVPDTIKWDTIPEDKRSALSRDPYKELGVHISEIDIFYFFQYSTNTPWVLKLTAQEAKIGAKIVFPDFGQYEPHLLPSNIEVLEIKGRVAILQKTENAAPICVDKERAEQ